MKAGKANSITVERYHRDHGELIERMYFGQDCEILCCLWYRAETLGSGKVTGTWTMTGPSGVHQIHADPIDPAVGPYPDRVDAHWEGFLNNNDPRYQ